MRYLALLALAFTGFPAMAVTHVDLFKTEVVLESTVTDADEKARVEGMKEVIVRASGQKEAISNSVVQKALSQSSDYLEKIRTSRVDGKNRVAMVFNDSQMKSLLVQAGLPLWPEERSTILVWLVEERSEREIIWEHSDSSVLSAIRDAAQRRGLPLLVPVGDFADITGVTASDLWGGFAKVVGQASQRYPVDAVLVVKGEGSDLRWTLYDQKPVAMGQSKQEIVSGASSGAQAESDMVSDVSDYFAEKNSVKVASESKASLTVQFTALNDPISFFILESKLNQLNSVASIDVINMQGAKVVLNLHLLSSREEFQQELVRSVPVVQQDNANEVSKHSAISGEISNAVVEEVPTVEASDTVAPTLTFEWQGKPEARSDNASEEQDKEATVDEN
ncbi:DUF2066 domain-containing protein [Vibrio japonicus]|uniref:DUF2066 domain-containing protein n=1 Tax=Vibrio japonicus TaxID=1824638 RepID=A0ABY5LGX1_9VIBR|nr:DUF2066 domain-containing protein [Vibrio japonicus]UUM31289.1 DUF2066 domain-containing protein [Vibrio japonicus]